MDIEFSDMYPSIINKWPEEYKYTGIALKFSSDLEVIERSTYGGLDWLGDIGGLFDALRIIGMALVGPFVKFALSLQLLTKIFYTTPRSTAD